MQENQTPNEKPVAPETPNNVPTTEQLITDLQAKVAENLNLAKYQKAEFENYKKRHQDAVTRAYADGRAEVIKMLLPIYDGMVEASKKIADPVDLAGFEIINKKFQDLFKQLGITVMVAKGQPFDPKLHNAAAVEHVEGVAPDTVLEEWQTGFLYNGQVLRPAMVKVSGDMK